MTRPKAPPALASPGSTVTLRAPRHRVERRAVLWWTLRVLLQAVPAVGTPAVTYWLWEASRPWLGPILLVVAGGFLMTAVVMPAARYHVHRWECTEHAVFELKGWLVREWRIIPVARVQTVDVVRGPLQQMLGLGTLRVITASPEGRVKIVGLDAERVMTEATGLTERIRASAGDAT